MTTFSALRESQDVPHVIRLEPNGWNDTYVDRPVEAVAIGIHSLSVDDITKARNEAAKWVVDNCDGLDTAEKIANIKIRMQCWAIASAACDPNNINRPYFRGGDDEVARVLRPEGMRIIYDAIEHLHITESVISPSADDEDVANLVAILSDPTTLNRLSELVQRRIRRVLRHALDALVPAQS